MERTLTLKDLLIWILENSDNTDAMDEINQASWRYTSKFKEKNGK